MTPAHSSRRGLTLIELIASLTVFLIVMATLVVAMNASLDSWRRSRERARQVITARAALDLIVDDLQHAIADPTNLFSLAVIDGTRQTRDLQANCAAFHRVAADPAADGLTAVGNVIWYLQPTNSLGALVRAFTFPAANGAPANRVVLAEGVATLQFVPLGISVSNNPPSELSASNLPPVIDVYLELLSPADGRRAQGFAPSDPARDAFIARRAVRVATRVAFSACQLPPQQKPAKYLCTGRVVDDASSQGLEGVSVDLLGPTNQLTRLTGTDGVFTFDVPSWWRTYMIVPQPPANQTGRYDIQQRLCRLSSGTLEGQDFRWTPSDLVISGVVTRADTGLGLAGLPIEFPNAGQDETRSDGSYSVGIAFGWPYGTAQVTPWHPHGGTFEPPNRSYTDVRNSMSGQDYVWTPPLLVISGYVTHAFSTIGVVDAFVAFSGIGEVHTLGDGFYSQTVPYEWTGLVTPGMDSNVVANGYFEPANASFSVLTRGVRQDFAWLQWPVAVSGHVFYGDSALGISNVMLRFDSGPTVFSGADGSYVGYVPSPWTGNVTPSYPYEGAFVPAYRSYYALSNSVAGQDYRWYAYEFVIAGRVTETNSWLTGTNAWLINSNAWLAVTNASILFVATNGYAAATNVLVDSNGYYSNRVSAGWSGVTVPASPLGGTFTPPTNTYVNVTNDWFGQDFVWTHPPVAVSGFISYTNSLLGMSNVTIRFDPGGPTLTNNPDGTYLGTLPFGWSGTATPDYPTAAGAFEPPQRLYNTVRVDYTNQHYQWFPCEILIAGRVTETNALLAVTNAAILFVSQQGYAAATNVFVNTDGTYSNRVTMGWSGVTIPTSPLGGAFTPPTNTYISVTNDYIGQDFLWRP